MYSLSLCLNYNWKISLDLTSIKTCEIIQLIPGSQEPDSVFCRRVRNLKKSNFCAIQATVVDVNPKKEEGRSDGSDSEEGPPVRKKALFKVTLASLVAASALIEVEVEGSSGYSSDEEDETLASEAVGKAASKPVAKAEES